MVADINKIYIYLKIFIKISMFLGKITFNKIILWKLYTLIYRWNEKNYLI